MSTQPRRRQFFSGLSTQFGLLMSLIIALTLLGNAWLTYHENTRQTDTNLQTRLSSIAQTLGDISIESLLIHDYLTIQDYLNNTARQKNVLFAQMQNQQGDTIGRSLNQPLSTNDPDPKHSLADIIKQLEQLIGADNFIYQQLPITFQGRQIATLSLAIDRRPFDQSARQNLYQNLLISLLTAIIAGMGIYAIFNHRVLVPINQLKDAAARVANFDLNQRTTIVGHNELSELGESFNNMTEHLGEAIADRQRSMNQLRQLNETLEERIHKRTQELQQMNSRVMHQAMHDPLTSLPNRSLIMERLKQSVRFARRHSKTVAIFMLDLDRFKEVNDTLGHPVGDQVLIEVSRRIPTILRETDTVGRLGGDEFIIILPETTKEDAERVAHKVMHQFAREFLIDGHHLSIGTSIGIAFYPYHSETPDTLIQRADIALYVAKKQAGEHIAIYNESEDHHSLSRLLMVTDLKDAIHNNKLELHYQPQVNLADGRVCGIEALCRWRHRVHGYISPDTFIPMAEDAGLIKALTNRVLEMVKADLQLWQESGFNIRVAVNLSMGNLLDIELISRIESLLSSQQMSARNLKLEITESMIMSEPERVAELLSSPTFRDVSISIDDFGTGYSSLSHLKRLPVNELKIDKSFIFNLAKDANDMSIVKTIIQLSQNMGLTVVAEGVEDDVTACRLQSMGCHIAQGYYYSRPVAANSLLDTIKAIEKRHADDSGKTTQEQRQLGC